MGEPKNKKDRALRILAQFLLTFYFQLPEGEIKKAFKSQADLACISLPMKYRFSREELEDMKPQQ